MERKKKLNTQLDNLLLNQGLLREKRDEVQAIFGELIVIAKLEERTMHLQSGQPYIDRPGIRIICGDKSLGIVRESGGTVKFVLGQHHTHGTIPSKFDSVYMKHDDEFNMLWDVIKLFGKSQKAVQR